MVSLVRVRERSRSIPPPLPDREVRRRSHSSTIANRIEPHLNLHTDNDSAGCQVLETPIISRGGRRCTIKRYHIPFPTSKPTPHIPITSHIRIVKPDHALVDFCPSPASHFPCFATGFHAEKGRIGGRLCFTSFLNGEEAAGAGTIRHRNGKHSKSWLLDLFSVLFPIEYRSPPRGRRRRRRWRWFREKGTGPIDGRQKGYDDIVDKFRVPFRGETSETPGSKPSSLLCRCATGPSCPLRACRRRPTYRPVSCGVPSPPPMRPAAAAAR